ncbi:MAG: alpha/beta hydrolase [Candidatus Promineifilaceae bacterium]|nr:alpha/beta hydrolase [Candidatus Promineifilaceae bacterium]
MSRIEIRGCDYYYENHGDGEETIFFAHGFLMSGEMFAAQVEALKDRYRCITFDWRGHGRSEVTADGYEMDSIYRDSCALIEALRAAPCHFVGFSMGGFVGLRVAARRPELVKTLTLIDTSAAAESMVNRLKYRLLAFVYRRINRAFAISQAMRILFGARFHRDPAWRAQRAFWREHIEQTDDLALKQAVSAVSDRPAVVDELDNISAPTLILIGEEEEAIGPEYAEQMDAGIANSKLISIPRAGHTTPVEAPQVVNEALTAFLATA